MHLFKILEYLLFLNTKFCPRLQGPARSNRTYLLLQLSSCLHSFSSSSAQHTCFQILQHSQLLPTLRSSYVVFTLAHYFSRLSFRYTVFDLDLSSISVPALLAYEQIRSPCVSFSYIVPFIFLSWTFLQVVFLCRYVVII